MPALLAAPLVALLAIIFMVALPVIIPLITLLAALDERHRKSAAASTRCIRCGLILGIAAVEKADEMYAAYVAVIKSKSWPSRVRLVERRLHAVCTGCGAQFGYNGKHRSFYVLERDEIDVPRHVI